MRLTLDDHEIASVDELAADVMSAADLEDECELTRYLSFRAQELPLRLRRFLDDMKGLETTATCVVSGIGVDDVAVGPTPSHWTGEPRTQTIEREEVLLLMVGSLLGDVFGWATQQDGKLVHDILPIRGQEQAQLGSGSEALLEWHTEEAFHPLKCDYLGLMCLRNHDGAATTVATVDDLELDDETRDVLCEPRFVIRPDDSHVARTDGPHSWTAKQLRLLEAARARIDTMCASPEPVPVLYGDPDSPYLCVDPYYMDTVTGDETARGALEALEAAVDAHLQHIVLEGGDILFIDNCRAVHGRTPFRPRYDGTDRWLKRINITRDLRRSRAYRLSADSRVVY